MRTEALNCTQTKQTLTSYLSWEDFKFCAAVLSLVVITAEFRKLEDRLLVLSTFRMYRRIGHEFKGIQNMQELTNSQCFHSLLVVERSFEPTVRKVRVF